MVSIADALPYLKYNTIQYNTIQYEKSGNIR